MPYQGSLHVTIFRRLLFCGDHFLYRSERSLPPDTGLGITVTASGSTQDSARASGRGGSDEVSGCPVPEPGCTLWGPTYHSAQRLKVAFLGDITVLTGASTPGVSESHLREHPHAALGRFNETAHFKLRAA